MPCYIERVLDFLERQSTNSAIPKQLQEDLQWAYELISQNKLYSANIQGFKLQEERPEIKAWTNMISMKDIPVNKREIERLNAFQALDTDKPKKKKSREKADVARSKTLSTQKKNLIGGGSAMSRLNDQRVMPEIDPFEMEFMQMVDMVEFSMNEVYD